MVVATIKRRSPTIGIKINANTGAIQTSTRLDSLTDVNASGETDGATLIYNQTSDVYEVKKLDLSNVTGDLDGGTF